MSYLDLTKTTGLATPTTNHLDLYVDTADKRLKSIDDTPTTIVFTGNATTDTLTNKTLTSPVINSLITGTAYPITIVTGSDVTTTSNTLVPITGLSFAINNGETWGFDATLAITGVGGGSKYGVAATPTGTLVMNVFGNVNNTSTFSCDVVTAVNTSSATALATTNSQADYVRISGTFVASSTATFQLQFLAVSGLTATVKKGSFLRGWRIS